MSTPSRLPIPWTKVTVRGRATTPRSRRTPDRGAPPRRPLSLPVMPQLALGDLTSHPAAKTPCHGAQPDRVDAAAAARLGVALRTRDSLQALFELNREEVGALIASGALVEVTLAAGLTRYALAESFAAATAGEEL